MNGNYPRHRTDLQHVVIGVISDIYKPLGVEDDPIPDAAIRQLDKLLRFALGSHLPDRMLFGKVHRVDVARAVTVGSLDPRVKPPPRSAAWRRKAAH